ncbi:NAD(P)H-dependent oxidoreductase [Vibrio nigripulchritudo]|uniref:NAD(P)H-dependent oxidoreductase n=1 Tax=Vibrio nigripulchritudo TaxID=28173 RepID=UPI0005F9D93A|nr:NAD(P)H-dependent oxidoreductase [Vibrio nigripulchritudo]KJY68096.1 oxidoreductase [Vibrio nigripulchritudo]
MKNILVINANPKSSSFSHALADSYEIQAREQAEVKRINLVELDFNISLDSGYDDVQPLEPSLESFQESVLWADHIVIVSPIWWGGLPAKFKGLLDRTFLPGFAFKFEEGSAEPKQLLTGKTSRLILTMDAPHDYVEVQAQPVIEQLDRFTLQFSGMEAAKLTLIGSVIGADKSQRDEWLKRVGELGATGL